MRGARRVLALVFGAAFVAGLTAVSSAQEEPFPIPKPGKEHKVLESDVGTWDATVKSWMDPKGEPTVSKGAETNKLFGGGLWLLSEFKGEFAGSPFEGHGQWGYDTNKKKYVGTWIDSMGTGIMTMEGTYDEKTKTLTMSGESFDPSQGKMVKFKSVGKYNPDGTRLFTMYMMPEGGGEGVKMMEISYTKRK